MTTGKTIALTRRTFDGKVISLLLSKAVSTLAGSFRKLPKCAVLQPPRPYKGPGCAHLTAVQQGEGAGAQRVFGEPGRHRRVQDVSDNEIKITSHIDGQVVITIHIQAPPPGGSCFESVVLKC